MTKIAFIGDIHGKNSSPLNRLCDYNEDLFNKLKYIRDYCMSKGIDTIVHLGDIHDKPEASDEWKNKFIEIWSQYNGKFYSIIGMLHDLFHNREESYNKTCLRNLELSGILSVIRKPLIIDNKIKLIPLNMRIKQAKEEILRVDELYDDSYVNVLLAHQFYDWTLDQNLGFTEEELLSIKNKFILILGHDHRQYDNMQIGNILVVRPGSLMRTELSEETIVAKPRIAVLDDFGNLEYVEIPHRDINLIYDVKEYRLRKSNTKLFKNIKNDISEIADYLHKSDEVISCSCALKEFNCPDGEYNYLKAVHQVCNQPF